MKKILTIILSCLLISQVIAQDLTGSQKLEQQQARFGKTNLTIEIANRPSSRSIGLMNRAELAKDHGMLFIFEQKQQLCFWMKNTKIALTIAFLDPDYRITQLVDMQPLDLTAHCSNKPAIAALEMNQGWFKAKNISLQDKLTLIRK